MRKSGAIKETLMNLFNEKHRERTVLALLTASLFLLYALSLPRKIWYDGDTVFSFQIFYAFYNHLLSTHEWMRWLPFGSYGALTDWWVQGAMSPVQILAILTGFILNIRDVNFVYKTSIFFEQWLLMFGTWFLSRQYFKTYRAAFFTALAMTAANLWLINIYWNFRIIYCLPLNLLFIHKFFKESNPSYLWISGILLILSQMGNGIYFVTWQIFICLTYFSMLGFKHREAFKSLFSFSRQSTLTFILMVALVLIYGSYVRHLFDNIISVISGRDASYTVNLETFLTFGAYADFSKLIGLFYGTYAVSGTSLYLGAAGLIFALYSMTRIKRMEQFYFIFMSVFFILLSAGKDGIIAKWVYYLYPLARIYRNVGALGAVIRFMLIFSAGWGFDLYLSRQTNIKEKENSHLLLLLCAGILFLIFLYLNIFDIGSLYFYKRFPLHAYFFWGVTFTLIAGASAFKIYLKNELSLFFIGLIWLDLLVFQASVLHTWPYQFDWISPETVSSAPIEYQPQRELGQNLTGRTENAARLVDSSGATLIKEALHFELYDHCLPMDKIQYHWNAGILDFVRLRANLSETLTPAEGRIELGKFFRSTLFRNLSGCTRPKIQFFDDVIYAENDQHAKLFAIKSKDPDNRIILENVPPEQRYGDLKAGPIPPSYMVTHYTYNHLRADVNIPGNTGLWLYYADAYHPDWKAYVDEKESIIAKANMGFKAVWIPSGKHRLEFRLTYGPQSFKCFTLMFFSLIFALIFFWKIGHIFFTGKNPI